MAARGTVGRVASAESHDRPAWFPSLAIDGTLALSAYLASYWLRFGRGHLETFLPTAWSTMPIVIACQLVSLAAVNAYGRWHGVDWIVRLIVGVVIGTALASGVVHGMMGFEGVSRMAFVADSILLSTASVAWRGVWALRQRAQAASHVSTDELVDHAEDMTTISGTVRKLFAYRELLRNLVLKDLKLKYRGSIFGFLWSLANPLLMTVVYTLAFTFILRIHSDTFVFSLLLGQLAWTFFASSAGMSTGAIVDNGGLLKSVLFPRAILPISVVLFNLAQFLLTVAVFLPIMLIWYRSSPSLPMLLFPAFLAAQVIFTVGVALALATATTFFRDVRHLLEVTLSILFWSTPILYELNQVPDRLRLVVLLSPLSSFVVAYQQMFVHRHWPEPAVSVIALAQAVGAFAVGAFMFMAFEDRFTEQV
jgi:lipopolysaccharide transport system permease protein